MKIIYQQDLLEIGSGGLRCALWCLTHQKDKGKKARFYYAYYAGKAYAYLWSLSKVGLSECLNPQKIYKYEEYLAYYRNGKIRIPLGPLFEVLMPKKFFNQILASPQPHQGKTVIKNMRLKFKEIKRKDTV